MFNRHLPEMINQLNTLIFSALSILTGVISIFLFTSGWVLTNPDRYKEALWEAGFYPRVPAIAAEYTASFLKNENCQIDPQSCVDGNPFFQAEEFPPFLLDLPEDKWVDIYSEILTSNWAQEQSENFLDQYFAYLNGELSLFSAQISLEYPKERLRGDPGVRVFQHIISAQPPCYGNILLQMVTAAVQGASLDELPLCRIPEEYTGHFSSQINQMMGMIAASFPDQATLGDIMRQQDTQGNPQPAPERNLRSEFSDFRTLTLLSPLAPLALALLVIIFGARSLKGLLLWLGLPLIITGVLAALLSFPLDSTISSLIASHFFNLHEVHYPNLLVSGYEASNYLAGIITSISRTAGIGLAVAGFLFTAFSLVVPSPPR
jgi:hypothetical protein